MDNDTMIQKSIEQTIHEKIHDLRSDNWNPWCIILNEKSYIDLCGTLSCKGYIISGSMEIEYYRDIMVVMDVNASENVRVLRCPHEELVYPLRGKE